MSEGEKMGLDCVYQVFLHPAARPANMPDFILVATEFPTLADLVEHLNSGAIVICDRLDTHFSREKRGVRIIHRRVPDSFTKAAVARLASPTWRIVEELDEAVGERGEP